MYVETLEIGSQELAKLFARGKLAEAPKASKCLRLCLPFHAANTMIANDGWRFDVMPGSLIMPRECARVGVSQFESKSDRATVAHVLQAPETISNDVKYNKQFPKHGCAWKIDMFKHGQQKRLQFPSQKGAEKSHHARIAARGAKPRSKSGKKKRSPTSSSTRANPKVIAITEFGSKTNIDDIAQVLAEVTETIVDQRQQRGTCGQYALRGASVTTSAEIALRPHGWSMASAMLIKFSDMDAASVARKINGRVINGHTVKCALTTRQMPKYVSAKKTAPPAKTMPKKVTARTMPFSHQMPYVSAKKTAPPAMTMPKKVTAWGGKERSSRPNGRNDWSAGFPRPPSHDHQLTKKHMQAGVERSKRSMARDAEARAAAAGREARELESAMQESLADRTRAQKRAGEERRQIDLVERVSKMERLLSQHEERAEANMAKMLARMDAQVAELKRATMARQSDHAGELREAFSAHLSAAQANANDMTAAVIERIMCAQKAAQSEAAAARADTLTAVRGILFEALDPMRAQIDLNTQRPPTAGTPAATPTTRAPDSATAENEL
jgi:hypothetical protein